MRIRERARRLVALAAAVAFGVGVYGCASSAGTRMVPAGTQEPDRFLYEKGTQELQKKHYEVARQYFKQLTEAYTQSQYRAQAKLGIGDTYMREGGADSLVLAMAEYREFLVFYPTEPRADYAQYNIALAHFEQMRAPQRDQTETREAIREFETFAVRYPDSDLKAEAAAKLREAKDRLSEADFLVGRFYYRQPFYPAAIDRLSTLLKADPEFTHRDAVYFYLAESLRKMKRDAEALPYYERVVADFEKSEYLDDARKRIVELKAQADAKS